jgi:hypothetical protein
LDLGRHNDLTQLSEKLAVRLIKDGGRTFPIVKLLPEKAAAYTSGLEKPSA